MKVFFKLAVFALLLTVFSGCATLVSGTKYPVTIHSNPPRANISISDKKNKVVYVGQSPATVLLKPGAGYFSKAVYLIKFSLPGYAEQIAQISFKFNGWYMGNILLGGALGMLIVDPATGAMWTLPQSQRNIHVTLPQSTALTNPALQIIDIDNVDTAIRKELVRLKQ